MSGGEGIFAKSVKMFTTSEFFAELILLLKDGGTLIVDDVLFHQNLNQEHKVSRRFKTISNRLEKFIEKCKNHPKFSEFNLKTIEDGLIFAKKGQNEK